MTSNPSVILLWNIEKEKNKHAVSSHALPQADNTEAYSL